MCCLSRCAVVRSKESRLEYALPYELMLVLCPIVKVGFASAWPYEVILVSYSEGEGWNMCCLTR